MASVLLMVEPRDLGLVTQVRSPHHEAPTIYLYETVPGGVGLAERLFGRTGELIDGAADLIAGCACERAARPARARDSNPGSMRGRSPCAYWPGSAASTGARSDRRPRPRHE